MKILKLITTIGFYSILFSCGHVSTSTEKLIPIDYLDLEHYYNLDNLNKMTADGWAINYFVKDDRTRYKDIYIECSKGNLKGIFFGEDLLEYRRYFIPEFITETDKHIYFSHGCATDCSAILVFNKDICQFRDYVQIVDYSIENEQLVYVADNSYENEFDLYELVVVDLRRNKTYSVVYKENICMGVFKEDCVDTIQFSPNKVLISTTLVDTLTHTIETRQTKEIIL
jgi:hypothetical protein